MMAMMAEPPGGTGAAELRGQVALVTGGGRGIGRAIVRALARAGATVLAPPAPRRSWRRPSRRWPGTAGRPTPGPWTSPTGQAVEALVAGAVAEFGAVDVLVNNAGSFAALGPVWAVEPEAWLRDVTTNLYGPFLCARAVLPHMRARRRGAILNLSGGGATGAGTNFTGYASSKAGILRFTEGWRGGGAGRRLRLRPRAGPGAHRDE